MKKLLLLLIISLSVLSCGTEEKVINPVDESYKVMVSSKEDFSVKIISIPDYQVINQNILQGILPFSLTGPITKIKHFGEYLYLSAQTDYKVIILEKNTLKLKAILDFSDQQAEVGEIAFPNSTDAYIVHPNKNYVSIIDITVFSIERQVTVGDGPVSIDVSGNQIIVANQKSNNISIIDSRSRKQEAILPVSAAPSFVKVSNDGKFAVAVSLGFGKIVDGDKSAAVITFYNIESRSEINYLDLGFGQIDPKEMLPVGFCITTSDWGFIPTRENLFRIDVKNKTDLKFVVRREFSSIIHDNVSSKLLLTTESDSKSEIIIANDKTGSISEVVSIPFKINYLLPWR